MKKTELISMVAEKCEVKKQDAEKIINAVLDTIVETIAEGEKVQLVGFGTFEQRTRNARTGCDPRTNQPIEIAASKVPAFKPGRAFKDAVNKDSQE